MASILTHTNITDATTAIEAYVTTCGEIYEEFSGDLTSLTSSNWTGDGAVGCKDFFDVTVTPALTDGIASIAKTLNDILLNIQDVMLDKLDPQLGEGNRNPGGAQ